MFPIRFSDLLEIPLIYVNIIESIYFLFSIPLFLLLSFVFFIFSNELSIKNAGYKFMAHIIISLSQLIAIAPALS